jgi:hypothetical protein
MRLWNARGIVLKRRTGGIDADAALLPPTGRARRSFFRRDSNKSLNKISNDGATISRGSYTMLPDESAVYYPEELSLLGEVLDQVVQSLPPDLRTPYNRAVLAQNVLACASTGERDPDKLRRAALNSKLSVAA